jgi:uncharacterized phage-associated protein
MANVYDISDYFIQSGIEAKRPITQISLQKLLYFAQGLHLGAYTEELFPDKIYAWKFGPVVQTVYSEFKYFGNNSITPGNPGFDTINRKFPGNREHLTEREKGFLRKVWELLGHLAPFELVELTHKQGSPWYAVWERFSGAIPPNTEISMEAMAQYFSRFIIKFP